MKRSDPALEVVLFRDHPAERWLSMNSYADNLMAALRACLPTEWRLRMPMPPRPRAGHYGRIIGRTLGYPWWARGRRGTINHILDHSYAHLLYGLDPGRTLVTVHDTAPRRFPGRRLGISRLAWEVAWSGLRRARHFVVTTRFVATELERYLHIPSEQCRIVPLGVSKQFKPMPDEARIRVRSRFVADGSFLLLHVGHAHPRKNLPVLVESLARLRRRGVPAVLVQVGGGASSALAERIERLDLAGAVRFPGYLPTHDLAKLYAAADVFVFPSRYEGFGLPVLEAMACGTPVVAAHTTSLPEVVGDAGLLVDPDDAGAMASTIERVLAEKDLRASLRQRGLARARQHSWGKTAQGTFAAYRTLVD